MLQAGGSPTAADAAIVPVRGCGRIARTELPNGIRILSEAMPGVASVAIGLWIESGSRHEQPAQSGLSHFIEHLFFKGTARRSAAQIAEEIDAVGGVLNADTDREFTCYYAKVLGEHASLAIDLLADIFLASQFDPEEIAREKEVVLEEIAQIKVVDVALPTKQGVVIRNRCIAQPTKAQAVLLQMLQLHLPQRMKIQKV